MGKGALVHGIEGREGEEDDDDDDDDDDSKEEEEERWRRGWAPGVVESVQWVVAAMGGGGSGLRKPEPVSKVCARVVLHEWRAWEGGWRVTMDMTREESRPPCTET